jgi:phosphohistidine phosphatase SixA
VIYLLRNGEAEAKNGDDAARLLTAKGERQAAAAGRALHEHAMASRERVHHSSAPAQRTRKSGR